jgi:hypothetical protein
MGMGFLIWTGVLPVCFVVAWLILRRPLRLFLEDLHLDHARDQFRLQREWLEARFVSSLNQNDPIEGQRWDDAHWHDEVYWARDRQSRRLLALVGVHFESDPFEVVSTHRMSTALFEYRKGRWSAEGKRLNEVRPDEAVGRNQRFEPVVVSQHPQPRRVG